MPERRVYAPPTTTVPPTRRCSSARPPQGAPFHVSPAHVVTNFVPASGTEDTGDCIGVNWNIRKSYQHRRNRARSCRARQSVSIDASPIMLLPKARLRIEPDYDDFLDGLRDGMVLPSDPREALKLSTIGTSSAKHVGEGSYSSRFVRHLKPTLRRPKTAGSDSERDSGISSLKPSVRFEDLRGNPSLVTHMRLDVDEVYSFSLPSTSSSQCSGLDETETDGQIRRTSIFPEPDIDPEDWDDDVPKHLESYASETRITNFGVRRNSMATLTSDLQSNVSSPRKLRRASLVTVDEFPELTFCNGATSFFGWMFSKYGYRKELQHLPRSNYVVRGGNPHFTNFVQSVPLHKRVDGSEGSDIMDEGELMADPTLGDGRRRRTSLSSCSGVEGRPSSPNSLRDEYGDDRDHSDVTDDYSNLIDRYLLDATPDSDIGEGDRVSSPVPPDAPPQAWTTSPPLPLKPEPSKKTLISLPKARTLQRKRSCIIKKEKKASQQKSPIKKEPEPVEEAEPAVVETPPEVEYKSSKVPSVPKIPAVIPKLPQAKEKTKAKRRQLISKRPMTFIVGEPYYKPETLAEKMEETRTKKPFDNGVTSDHEDSSGKTMSRVQPWLQGRLALSQQSSRFELPMDMKLLETMTPQDYVRKHCIISTRRQHLYQKVFQKSRDVKLGSIPFKDVEKAMKEVLVNIISQEQVKELCALLEINQDSTLDYKLFCGMAALAERVLYPKYVTEDTSDLPEFQREKIECADFSALSWKFNGVNVNPSVERILKSLV